MNLFIFNFIEDTKKEKVVEKDEKASSVTHTSSISSIPAKIDPKTIKKNMKITKSALPEKSQPKSSSIKTKESRLKTHQKPSRTLLSSTRVETKDKSLSLSKHSRRDKITELHKMNDLSTNQRQRQKSINLTGIAGANTMDNRNLVANSFISPISAHSK